MAWFELHEQFARHRKVARLAGELSISRMEAKGYVVSLWCWVTAQKQDGDLSEISDIEIAAGCDWEGDPSTFVRALKSAGWIDRDRHVHDWSEMGVRLLRGMRERKANERKEKKSGGASGDGPAIVARQSRPTDLTDPPDLASEEHLVSDAPRRAVAASEGELVALAFILRPHKAEFDLWCSRILGCIARENERRNGNPFTWNPKTGTIIDDLRGLVYGGKLSDEQKRKILEEAYNTLKERLNWLNYVELAITYTIVVSRHKRIQSPFLFTKALLTNPRELVNAKSDGILAHQGAL